MVWPAQAFCNPTNKLGQERGGNVFLKRLLRGRERDETKKYRGKIRPKMTRKKGGSKNS